MSDQEKKGNTGIAEEYRASGKTRLAFCQERGVPVTTLGYYIRRQQEKEPQKMMRVQIVAKEKRPVAGWAANGLAVVFRNGRRLEIGGSFDDQTLPRLLSAIEQE